MVDATRRTPEDFRDVCFVIMPFGTKPVGKGWRAKKVDFNKVFENVFKPAIEAVELPAGEGGGRLRAVRTDREFHTGDITQDMYEYIAYARFALADITGLNANVFYELGARHHAQESGTAIFRLGDAPIPFDIAQIKAFPYTIHPTDEIEESKKLVRRVLTESLARNAWDSPIRKALRVQQETETRALRDVLIDAENAVRAGKFDEASRHWAEAAKLDPKNPIHDLKASYGPKKAGKWDAAIALLQSALAKEPNYAEVHRELGIAKHKRDRKTFARAGEEDLRKAVAIDPEDFDAWSSLGGVLKRAGDEPGALACYEKAVEISNGHPYPLLNAIKLKAKQAGKLEFDMKTMKQLGRAEGFRQAQVENDPPIDVPWSFFDLAEIKLYGEERDEALAVARKGLELSTADWMPGTFLDSLGLLPEGCVDGLQELTSLAGARRAELSAGTGGS